MVPCGSGDRMTPEVFIATVPWRRENLDVLVASLNKQTVVPAFITIVCDNYVGHELPKEDDGENFLVDSVVDSNGHVGAGYRWKLIDELVSHDEEALVLVIDDDIAIAPDYVERCVAAYERLQAPLSWNGMTFTDVYIAPEKDLGADARLLVLGAGTTVVPSHFLKGIAKDPMAAELFGVYGDDEALVSWFLAKQGLRLYRPRGPSGAWSTKFQCDPRSQWAQKGGRHFGFRSRLKERGWPLVDPPPEYVRKQRFHGTAQRVLPQRVRTPLPQVAKGRRFS